MHQMDFIRPPQFINIFNIRFEFANKFEKYYR